MPHPAGKEPSPTVLVVDDDAEIRHALTLLFEFEDFLVVGEAANGVEAIALAKRLQPQFVVLDYLMPRMDGEATAELLRAIAPKVRIVAFSAVLEESPPWADAYLNKNRISDIAPLLNTLIPDLEVVEVVDQPEPPGNLEAEFARP